MTYLIEADPKHDGYAVRVMNNEDVAPEEAVIVPFEIGVTVLIARSFIDRYHRIFVERDGKRKA